MALLLEASDRTRCNLSHVATCRPVRLFCKKLTTYLSNRTDFIVLVTSLRYTTSCWTIRRTNMTFVYCTLWKTSQGKGFTVLHPSRQAAYRFKREMLEQQKLGKGWRSVPKRRRPIAKEVEDSHAKLLKELLRGRLGMRLWLHVLTSEK